MWWTVRSPCSAATGTSSRSCGCTVRRWLKTCEDPDHTPPLARSPHLPVPSRLAILALILATARATAPLAEGSAAWTPSDITVSRTVAGQPGSVSTHFEVGATGDARIAVDLRNEGTRTKGTILLISGRWMLTQGFAAAAGKEIEALDAAALNSQLVIVLLTAALPKGPPAPGGPQHVRVAEKINPIRIATASRSAEYLAPWTVVGSVTVPVAEAPASYQLSFTYSAEGFARTIDFAGSVGNAKPPLEFPDSMKLAGWKIHRLPSPSEASVHHAAPRAATLGELRALD
jgi:hypothetical protein